MACLLSFYGNNWCAATDWANDGLFGDGWHLFGIGSAACEEASEEYGDTAEILEAYENGDVAWIFAPVGWANLAAAFTHPAGMSFLIFNLICVPCFAAICTIKHEMNSRKWTWAAIGYQCGFAYAVSFVVYQFGSMFRGNGNTFMLGTIIISLFLFLLFHSSLLL